MLNTNEKVRVALAMRANGETVAFSETNEKISTPETETAWRLRVLDQKVAEKVKLTNGLEFGFTKDGDQILYHPTMGYDYVVASCLAREVNLFKTRFFESAISAAFKTGVIKVIDNKQLLFDGRLLISQKLLNDDGQNFVFKKLSAEACEMVSKMDSEFLKGLTLSYDCFEEVFSFVADHISTYDLLYIYKEPTDSYLDWVQQIQERKAQ